MRDFILVQYKLYQAGGKSIGIEKIKRLAQLYLTEDERNTLEEGETSGE